MAQGDHDGLSSSQHHLNIYCQRVVNIDVRKRASYGQKPYLQGKLGRISRFSLLRDRALSVPPMGYELTLCSHWQTKVGGTATSELVEGNRASTSSALGGD